MSTTIRIIAETIISQTQQIAQAINSLQVVNCENKSQNGSETCKQCLLLLKDFENEQLKCDKFCRCSISDVNFDQVLLVNFQTLQTINSDAFLRSFLNNLYLDAKARETGLPGLTSPENQKLIEEQAFKMLNLLKSTTIQQALQGLSADQVVKVNGPGTVIGTNLKQAINNVSIILQSNQEFLQEASTMETYLSNITTKMILTASDVLIVSFIMIIAIVVAILLIYFSIKSIIDLLASVA